jgi:hypothetical protein
LLFSGYARDRVAALRPSIWPAISAHELESPSPHSSSTGIASLSLSLSLSSHNPSPHANSLKPLFSCQPGIIRPFTSPRSGLVLISQYFTRSSAPRLAAYLPARRRRHLSKHESSSPHQLHPRVPWPYSFTSTMSSSEDDKPLVKGMSRVFICLSVTHVFSQFACFG